MTLPFVPGAPAFGLCPTRAAFSNILTAIVPPYPGPGPAPLLYNAGAPNAAPNWYGSLYTHLTSLVYTCSTTAHTLTVCRPLNWTYFPAGLPKNTTLIPNSTATGIATDPGLYTTSYMYPLPSGIAAPAAPADAAISSTNKFVTYQLSDGTWVLDTIASGTFGSSLTLTTGTPNTAAGAIPAGGPLFYFGALALVNPQTTRAHDSFLVIASALKIDQLGSSLGSTQGSGAGIGTINPGDPMLVHSNNATATGIIEFVGGDYRKN